jgi:hypothetical protein
MACSIASIASSSTSSSGQLPNSKLSLIACCLVHDSIAPPYIDREFGGAQVIAAAIFQIQQMSL